MSLKDAISKLAKHSKLDESIRQDVYGELEEVDGSTYEELAEQVAQIWTDIEELRSELDHLKDQGQEDGERQE